MSEIQPQVDPRAKWVEFSKQPVGITELSNKIVNLNNPKEGFKRDLEPADQIRIIARLAMNAMENVKADGKHRNHALIVKSGFEHLWTTKLEDEDKSATLERIKSSITELLNAARLASADQDLEGQSAYIMFFKSLEHTCAVIEGIMEQGEATKIQKDMLSRVAVVLKDDFETPEASNDN